MAKKAKDTRYVFDFREHKKAFLKLSIDTDTSIQDIITNSLKKTHKSIFKDKK